MERAPRSRKQALILCMEMYEWLRDNRKSNYDKYEWPRISEWKKLENTYHCCFCCMFAKFECNEKCPLMDIAWFQSLYGAPCVHNKSLYYDDRYCGADKMVWACYVALNEIAPKEFPLNFAQITNP